jgi:hypothetical protein
VVVLDLVHEEEVAGNKSSKNGQKHALTGNGRKKRKKKKAKHDLRFGRSGALIGQFRFCSWV